MESSAEASTSAPPEAGYAPYTVSDERVSPYWVERYEREAARNWDSFYRRHGDKFFKDRHYLQAEWPELAEGEGRGEEASDRPSDEPIDDAAAQGGDAASDVRAALLSRGADGAVLLEAGCGVGNTLFPLLAANPKLRCFGFDFSETAISIVQQHPLAASGRVVAAVGDLTRGCLPAELQPCAGRADLATLMFVLSAISPEKMGAAVATVAEGLREGGLLLFRDYALGDGAQRRLQDGAGCVRAKQLDAEGRFYVRQDGTRAYFFEAEELCELMGRGGFDTVECKYCTRETVNRGKGVTLQRYFLTAKFVKSGREACDPAVRSPLIAERSDVASTSKSPAAEVAANERHQNDQADADGGRGAVRQSVLEMAPPLPKTDAGRFDSHPFDGPAQLWSEVKHTVRGALNAAVEASLARDGQTEDELRAVRRRLLLELLGELDEGVTIQSILHTHSSKRTSSNE
ncbi:hypothetical protein AB1Y20_001522 [Prymnesium parvum]|uniref:Methyltransferase-like protein n=1 Tax=Prymnesium parvum TaxID=97485 RepID=A0AB34KBC0_PRYPA